MSHLVPPTCKVAPSRHSASSCQNIAIRDFIDLALVGNGAIGALIDTELRSSGAASRASMESSVRLPPRRRIATDRTGSFAIELVGAERIEQQMSAIRRYS